MENVDWSKALTDIVNALNNIAESLSGIEYELHDMNDRGILVYQGESDGC